MLAILFLITMMITQLPSRQRLAQLLPLRWYVLDDGSLLRTIALYSLFILNGEIIVVPRWLESGTPAPLVSFTKGRCRQRGHSGSELRMGVWHVVGLAVATETHWLGRSFRCLPDSNNETTYVDNDGVVLMDNQLPDAETTYCLAPWSSKWGIIKWRGKLMCYDNAFPFIFWAKQVAKDVWYATK